MALNPCIPPMHFRKSSEIGIGSYWMTCVAIFIVEMKHSDTVMRIGGCIGLAIKKVCI